MPKKQLAIQKNQKVLGVAIYFFTYSTWEGPVLYVEDLFVIPAVRGKLTGVRLRIRCTQNEIYVRVNAANHQCTLKL